MKKFLAMVVALVLALSMFAFANAEAKTSIKVGAVTDVGGVNDKSFNQTTWDRAGGGEPQRYGELPRVQG